MRYIRLYKIFIFQYFKMLMEYKKDFIIGVIGFILTQITGVAFIYIIFQRIPSLNGWGFYELLFVYGFAQIPRGIDHLITDNLWALSGRIIVRGEFDRYLLRPINPLFHLIAEVFQFDAVGELVVGITLIGVSITKLSFSINFLNICFFVIVIINGAIIYSSIKLFFASLAFWIKMSQSILYTIYNFSDFVKYPMSIYPKVFSGILTFVIPFAFTAIIPAGYFLEKEQVAFAIVGSVIVAIVISIIAYCAWKRGIMAYESSGN